jgi:predicted MFS family arabinose efflux permease
VVSIPLLHAGGSLRFDVLVGLVAVAGLLRGSGDTAKRVIFPKAVEASGLAITRATSLHDGLSRLAGLLGAPLAGALIAVFGAPNVLLLDAATFAFAAMAVGLVVPRLPASTRPKEPYLRSLRTGLYFVSRNPIVRAIVVMLFCTNLFDAAHGSVLAPVWARDVAGTAVALGMLSAAFGVGAVLGNVVFTALAPRLPRLAAYGVGFLIGGAPRFLAPAVTDELWPVYVVTFVAGFAIAAVNPILGAVQYEHVPEELRSRVLGLTFAVAWAGIPLGALLGGWTVQLLGLRPSWLIFGGLYLVVTLLPFVQPTWREVDRKPSPPMQQPAQNGGDLIDVGGQ